MVTAGFVLLLWLLELLDLLFGLDLARLGVYPREPLGLAGSLPERIKGPPRAGGTVAPAQVVKVGALGSVMVDQADVALGIGEDAGLL